MIIHNAKLGRLNISDSYNAPVLSRTMLQTCSIQISTVDLINFSSSYSREYLKTYTYLEGYEWTQSGFLMTIHFWRLSARNCVFITGRVSICWSHLQTEYKHLCWFLQPTTEQFACLTLSDDVEKHYTAGHTELNHGDERHPLRCLRGEGGVFSCRGGWPMNISTFIT